MKKTKQMNELNREYRELENEKKLYNRIIKSEQETFAKSLKGSIGKDMEEVLTGKKVVKLSLIETINYKIKKFLTKLFKTL